MVGDVCIFVQEHRDVWKGNIRVEEKLGKLTGLRERIGAANIAFINGNTQAYTKAEALYFETAVKSVLRLTNAVTEWASSEGDLILLAQVKCAPSDIVRLRHSDRIVKLNSLHGHCEAQAGNIPGCELTAEDFQTARVAIDGYASLKVQKRQKANARKVEGKNIVQLLRATIPLLKELDLLMRSYEKSHPEFFRQYMVTRRMLNRGGAKTARIAKGNASTTFNLTAPPADATGAAETPPPSPDADIPFGRRGTGSDEANVG